MRFLTCVLSIAFLTMALGFFLPWWSLILAAIIVGMAVDIKPGLAFLSGFLGIGLVWFLYSLFIDVQTASVLSDKVCHIFRLQTGLWLLLVSALLAGLTGAFASLTGNSLRAIVK